MIAPHQDIALFTSVQQGERLALTTLFTNYYQPLCQFAYQYVRNKEEAEEVVSEVFVQLWKNRHRITIYKSVKAYLYTSVKHACIASLRARQPFFETIDDVLTSAHVTDGTQPQNLMEFKELQDHFHYAVDQLPPRCRQVFVLSRFDNLKYKEISEVLDISEKTVEHQLAKALSILRETLQRYFRELH